MTQNFFEYGRTDYATHFMAVKPHEFDTAERKRNYGVHFPIKKEGTMI